MISLKPKDSLIVSGIALGCALIASLFSLNTGILSDLENRMLDYRFKVRGGISVDPRIVLVDIDDQSLSKIGRWPWERTHHAKMIEILSKSGAAVIGYDVLFNQPGEKSEDEALMESIKRAGNVILPVGFKLEKENGSDALLSVKREVGPFPEVRDVAAGVGHISSNRDTDGTIRRVPLMVQGEEQRVPSFSLSMLMAYYRVPQQNVFFQEGRRIVLRDVQMAGLNARRENVEVPVDREGMMQINFAGQWVDTFDHLSFIDVLEAWDSEEGRGQLAELLRGKICVISNTATGYDLKPVPLEKDYPGGGIHASALNTVLTEQYLYDAGSWAEWGLLLIFSLGTTFFTIYSRWWLGLISSTVLMLVFGGVAFVAFSRGLIIQTFPPILAIVLSYVSTLGYQNWRAVHAISLLSSEKEKLSKSLREIGRSLKGSEQRLHESRSELSRLKYETEGLRGQSKEKIERIEFLEAALDRATLEQEDLLREKRTLEERMADLLVEPISGKNRGREWSALQQECSRHGIVTQNQPMLRLFERAKKAASSRSPVLITGETGTGKEPFAWAVHRMSSRADKPFIAVSIPALQDNLLESELFGHLKGSFTGATSDKKGRFQMADGGTIFLDEIGEMKLELQAKLLRVLQTGEVDRLGATAPICVDVRVIAATNRDLQDEVKRGSFREDLYYRLNVINIHLPPLRERPEDIEVLAEYFLNKCALEGDRDVKGFTAKALECLKSHSWRGNIRELEHAIARGVAMVEGDRITEADLELKCEEPEIEMESVSPQENYDTLDPDERLTDSSFLDLLRENQFEIGRTSQQLKVARGTVGSRFKGICFRVLAQHEGDISKAARALSQGKAVVLVEKRIQEYYENLMEVVRQYDKYDDALQECRRRFKNLPQKYFSSLDALIKAYFNQTTTKH